MNRIDMVCHSAASRIRLGAFDQQGHAF